MIDVADNSLTLFSGNPENMTNSCVLLEKVRRAPGIPDDK